MAAAVEAAAGCAFSKVETFFVWATPGAHDRRPRAPGGTRRAGGRPRFFVQAVVVLLGGRGQGIKRGHSFVAQGLRTLSPFSPADPERCSMVESRPAYPRVRPSPPSPSCGLRSPAAPLTPLTADANAPLGPHSIEAALLPACHVGAATASLRPPTFLRSLLAGIRYWSSSSESGRTPSASSTRSSCATVQSVSARCHCTTLGSQIWFCQKPASVFDDGSPAVILKVR